MAPNPSNTCSPSRVPISPASLKRALYSMKILLKTSWFKSLPSFRQVQCNIYTLHRTPRKLRNADEWLKCKKFLECGDWYCFFSILENHKRWRKGRQRYSMARSETQTFTITQFYGSITVSGKLPTYPSPKPTFCPKWEESANAGLREGWVGSFPETR